MGELVAKVLPWRKEVGKRFVVEFTHNIGVYLEERMNCAQQEGAGVGYVLTFGRTPLSIISMSLRKCIDCGVKSGVSVPRKRRSDLSENALSSLGADEGHTRCQVLILGWEEGGCIQGVPPDLCS